LTHIQAPTDASNHFLKRRAGVLHIMVVGQLLKANCRLEEDALGALEAMKVATIHNAKLEADLLGDRTTMTETADPEVTYSTNASGQPPKSGGTAKVKKGAKPKLSAREKKERGVRAYSPGYWEP
jgi:DASH complex subunit DAM1